MSMSDEDACVCVRPADPRKGFLPRTQRRIMNLLAGPLRPDNTTQDNQIDMNRVIRR